MKKLLTNREKDVLQVLWSSQEPLHASQISGINPNLSISSVQVALRSLMKKAYIEVADITHSGTVLARRYRSLLKEEDYLRELIGQNLEQLDKNVSPIDIVEALLDKDENVEETLRQLEVLLKKKKKELKAQAK